MADNIEEQAKQAVASLNSLTEVNPYLIKVPGREGPSVVDARQITTFYERGDSVAVFIKDSSYTPIVDNEKIPQLVQDYKKAIANEKSLGHGITGGEHVSTVQAPATVGTGTSGAIARK